MCLWVSMTTGCCWALIWQNQIKNSTYPQVIPDIDAVTVDDKQVAIISVQEHGVIATMFEEFQHGFRVTIYKERLEVGSVSDGVSELLALITVSPGNILVNW